MRKKRPSEAARPKRTRRLQGRMMSYGLLSRFVHRLLPDVRRKGRFPERVQAKSFWGESGKRELSVTFPECFRLPPDCFGWIQP